MKKPNVCGILNRLAVRRKKRLTARQLREFIEQNVSTDDAFAEWALKQLWYEHDDKEKLSRKAIYLNGRGYGKSDARVLLPLTAKMLAGHPVDSSLLAPARDRDKWGHPLLGRYWIQLWELVDPFWDMLPVRLQSKVREFLVGSGPMERAA